jgi:hypothetical protein
MLKTMLALLTLTLATGAAQAHAVWIEVDDAAARAYFGEWQEDLREKTGGRLDTIKSLRAFATDRNQSLTITPGRPIISRLPRRAAMICASSKKG